MNSEQYSLQCPAPRNEEENQFLDDKTKETPVGWDEGGLSNCGCSDSIQDTLMSISGSIQNVFGEPRESLQIRMMEIGNYFQEISCDVGRDMKRGTPSVRNKSDEGADVDDDVSDVSSLGSS
ncbi:hypothetical protein ACHAXR_010644 [Thalassiosira sp. AJA248-18]